MGGFEDFEPIYGQPNAEWGMSASAAAGGSPPNSTRNPPPPFLFWVTALDPSQLRFFVTDFHSNTWEAIRSVQQFEDMRDNMGIGGSWSEFVDYVIVSIKSQDVKLILEGQSKSDGAAYAALVCQKSKGLPLVSVSLAKLVGAAANEAIGKFSLELYKAFRSTQNEFISEQERCYQLTKMISAEQGKNENLQRQLDRVLNSGRQKLQKINDKATSDSVSTLQDSDKQAGQNLGSAKARNRVIPAYRRAKVRGVILQDTEDDEDN